MPKKQPSFDEQATSAANLAMESLVTETPAPPPKKKARFVRTAEQIEADNYAKEEARDAKRDLALWAEANPQTKDEARYFGNLKYRFIKGITNQEIKGMTIRDRMTASRQCFDIQQLLLDKPTGNIRFQDRHEMDAALPALQAELARRQRERGVVEINPEDYHAEKSD